MERRDPKGGVSLLSVLCLEVSAGDRTAVVGPSGAGKTLLLRSLALLDTLDAPNLPLVVLEAAGIPLDSSFAEQKRILQRCRGQFYLCNNGAEARRFNRMLIDAGLIRGL